MSAPSSLTSSSKDAAHAERRNTVAMFNPRSRQFIENPYPTYAVLRDSAPVHRAFFGAWVVTRYEHVKAGLLDPRLRAIDIPDQLRAKSAHMQQEPDGAAPLEYLIANTENWLAFFEPPQHGRLRGAVADSLKKAAVEKLRPTIRKCAKQLLDQVYPRGRMDLIGDFAQPLPAYVLAHVLGVPADDVPMLTRWMCTIIPVLDPLTSFSTYQDMNLASRHFLHYLDFLIDERRKQPRDDLISGMVANHSALTTREIASTCIHLFGAGVQTSTNLFANGIAALLANPEKFAELKSDLSLIATSNEELIRYDPSLQFVARKATVDLAIAGTTIAANETVYLVIGAANRDPRRFSDPDSLNLHRRDNPHLSFGAGHHYCVGGTLARVEAHEAMFLLLQMFPNMKLTSEKPPFLESGIALRRRPRLEIEF